MYYCTNQLKSKKKLKQIILLGSIICFSTFGFGQKYNTVGGIRIADDFGISFAQRIANKSTVELNIQPGTFAGHEMISVLAKQHYPLVTKRLNFFMGAGVYSRKAPSVYIDNPQSTKTKGVAFTFGAEFSIGNLNISTDYVPMVTINKNDSNQRFYTTSGFSLRYIFLKRDSGTKKFFKKLFRKD